MTAELIVFAILAAIAVACGILMVLHDNPVHSALCLVGVLFSIAILLFVAARKLCRRRSGNRLRPGRSWSYSCL